MKSLDELSRAISQRAVAPATLVALLTASFGAGALLALTAPPPHQRRAGAPVEVAETENRDAAQPSRRSCPKPIDPAG